MYVPSYTSTITGLISFKTEGTLVMRLHSRASKPPSMLVSTSSTLPRAIRVANPSAQWVERSNTLAGTGMTSLFRPKYIDTSLQIFTNLVSDVSIRSTGALTTPPFPLHVTRSIILDSAASTLSKAQKQPLPGFSYRM